MTLEITLRGATPQEIERGIAAASEIFEKAKVTPEEALMILLAIEGGSVGAAADDREGAYVDTWFAADQAAVEACCRGWPDANKPDTASLQIKEAREEIEQQIAKAIAICNSGDWSKDQEVREELHRRCASAPTAVNDQ